MTGENRLSSIRFMTSGNIPLGENTETVFKGQQRIASAISNLYSVHVTTRLRQK